METYKHSRSFVGANRKHIQLTPKYRYKMMRSEKLKVFCRVAIEEACKKHGIAIEIIKGLSSYILFRICENLRKRYPKGHFWHEGYFCNGVGNSDYAQTYIYIDNQEMPHAKNKRPPGSERSEELMRSINPLGLGGGHLIILL